MQKILTLLLSFPVFGMKVDNRLSSAEAWMTGGNFTPFTQKAHTSIQELEKCVLTEPLDCMMLLRSFAYCAEKPSDLSRPILEKALLKASGFFMQQAILDHCITQRIHLSTETLNEALLKASDWFTVRPIFHYYTTLGIHLSTETLNEVLLKTPILVTEAILKCCLEYDINLSPETLKKLLLRASSHFLSLKKILDYCIQKQIFLSDEILEQLLSILPDWKFQETLKYLKQRKIIISQNTLEELLAHSSDHWRIRTILQYCQENGMVLSQAILENLLPRADEWTLRMIFRYCQESRIVLLQNTLENSPLRLSHGWVLYEIFQYFKESGIILSQAILRNLIRNSQLQIRAEILDYIIQTNLIVSEDALWDLINYPELRTDHHAMLGYLERLNMHPGVQNYLRSVLGNEEINNATDESIIEINVASYLEKSFAMLSTHLTKHQKPDTKQYLMKRFEAHIAKLPKEISSIEAIRKKIEPLSGADMGRLVRGHVETPYWIEGNLSPEEIQARWTVFFNSFISGVGFANYGKENRQDTTSCSPDRACVEAFAAIKEPLAMLAILRQRNAGPLTEEISVSNPNGEVDAVIEMGISLEALKVFEELVKDSPRIDFSLSEEENIRILENGHLCVIRPKKTCDDDMRVLGAFSAEWTRKTYDEPIDFEDKKNEKWKRMRHELAESIYRVLKYRKFNPSASYDVEWFREKIKPKNKDVKQYASEVAFKLQELKAQKMILLGFDDLEQLYHEVVRSHFPIFDPSQDQDLKNMTPTEALQKKLNEGEIRQKVLRDIFQNAFPESKPEPQLEQEPEIKTESEVMETEVLPGFLQPIHIALLIENKEGYTKAQFIHDYVARHGSYEEAERAVRQYKDLLFLLPETK